jgi:hypothetical protein
MASLLLVDGTIKTITKVPLTLGAFLRHLGEEIEMIDLLSGDILAFNPHVIEPLNNMATKMVAFKKRINGNAILCTDLEIA